MFKHLLLVALAALALSAPAALAAGPQSPGSGDAKASASLAGPRLKLALLRRELRVLHRCAERAQSAPTGSDGSTPAGQRRRCTTVATRLPDQLQKLDAAVQQRIAKIQQTCSAPTVSTGDTAKDPCANAERRTQLLQTLDQKIQQLIAKLQQAPAATTTG